MCRSQSQRPRAGFLLVEVSLTVAILSIGIIMVLQSYRSCLQAVRRTQDLSRAIWLAQEKMAEMSLLAEEAEPLTEKEGDFLDAPGFYWRMEPETVEENDRLKRVHLTIYRQPSDGPRWEQIPLVQEFLKKS